MSSRTIGKIVSIGTNGIVAEVYDSLGSYVNTVDGIRFVGEVGSYVSIYEIGRTIIAEIESVAEKSSIVNGHNLNKANSNRQIFLNLIGEIIDNKFFFGVSKMPLIFSEVNIISEKDLMIMLEVGNEEEEVEEGKTRALLLPIGESVIFSDYTVKINIDKFFGFHFAVFGNTGAGKSNTIARILQNIFLKTDYSAKGAKFIIIDSNGEYHKAFENINGINNQIKETVFVVDSDINDGKLEIPVWALSADDWAILLHASEKTQLPVIKRAIDIARIFYDEDNTDNAIKNHILASTLLGIINSSDSSPSKYDKLVAIMTHFATEEININVVISEDKQLTLKQDSYYGAVGYNIFERIAKEGRKYGFLLGISSQRPSELSKTVVSQCSNFIIHRVQNPDDLKYISSMVPYINNNMIERLTYLQTGNALVFGTAINIPTLTKFEQANPSTDSENAKITEKWYIQ